MPYRGHDAIELNVGSTDQICIRKLDRHLYCWEVDGDTNHHYTDPPPGLYKAVCSGAHTGCAITLDDSVVCWGITTDNASDYYDARPSSGNDPAVQITCGGQHVCIVTQTRSCPTCTLRFACQGWNRDGQLANTNIQARVWDNDVVKVSAGWSHTCVLRRNGNLDCYGVPGDDDHLGGVVQFHAGSGHTMILRSDGTAIGIGGFNNWSENDPYAPTCQ